VQRNYGDPNRIKGACNCLGEHIDSWLTGRATDFCMSLKFVIIVSLHHLRNRSNRKTYYYNWLGRLWRSFSFKIW